MHPFLFFLFLISSLFTCLSPSLLPFSHPGSDGFTPPPPSPYLVNCSVIMQAASPNCTDITPFILSRLASCDLLNLSIFCLCSPSGPISTSVPSLLSEGQHACLNVSDSISGRCASSITSQQSRTARKAPNPCDKTQHTEFELSLREVVASSTRVRVTFALAEEVLSAFVWRIY